jgi:hypothetical protein
VVGRDTRQVQHANEIRFRALVPSEAPMDTRPYILAAVLVFVLSGGFLIGFNSVEPEQQIALNWSVPSGPEAYPANIRFIR